MTQSFEDMIYLFSCGALGLDPELDHSIDIPKIYENAIIQGVWNTVFLSLKNLYDNKKINIKPEIFNKLNYHTVYVIATNTNRMLSIHNMLQKLLENGVNYCLLKGEVLANLYNDPLFRISTDTDIYIDLKDQEKTVKILEELEFDVKPLNPTSHHIVAVHKIMGTVEIHLHLYDELFEDVWFDNKILNKEEYRFVTIDDGLNVPTLGITDGLIFVTLHYIKHFLSKGVGIRQLMDVLIYMKTYNNEIDWERFNNLMDYLKYRKFIEYSIRIGVKYLNFDESYLSDYIFDDELIEKILLDIENGGVFGKNEKERHGFYLQYTKERFNRFKKENYNNYINKWWRPYIIRIIFPNIRNLEKKYQYLKKSSFLYPIAWLHRIINGIISIVNKKRSIDKIIKPQEETSNEIYEKRMELIRDLDMI